MASLLPNPKQSHQDEEKHLESSSPPTTTTDSDADPNDPQLWPSWLRHICLFQLAVNALMVGFTGAIIIPGEVPISEQLGILQHKASYLASVHVLFLSFGPLLWAPLVDAVGRRPCFILAMLLSFAANIGGAYTTAFGTLMTARVLQAIGISIGGVFGASVVVDLFEPEGRAGS